MENVDFLNIQQIYYWIYQLFSILFYYLNPVKIFDLYYQYWPQIMFFGVIISVLCLVGLWNLYQKIKEVNEKGEKVFGTIITSSTDMGDQPHKNERWERILNYLNSDSPTEWRLAILDADIILDKMLTKSGYHGEGVGEKLKQVERSDFQTLDSAWEAHKIRNTVAHSGSDTILTKRTAKKAIDLYRQVFEEFKYI